MDMAHTFTYVYIFTLYEYRTLLISWYFVQLLLYDNTDMHPIGVTIRKRDLVLWLMYQSETDRH